MQQTQKLILASASPRRAELLRALGVSFEVSPTHADEDIPDSVRSEDAAGYLANIKSLAAEHKVTAGTLVMTADTIVLLDDQVLNKPADAAAAHDMLSLLSGKTHQVISAYCIAYHNDAEVARVARSSTTAVTLGPLSTAEIAYYVARQPPFDKAGGYGIQDWIGWAKVMRLEGSYANVMGLPTECVYADMVEQGWLTYPKS